jgi:hypothetical protein
MSGGLAGDGQGHGNGKIERTSTAIISKDGNEDGEEKKKRGMGGLLARARGGRWSVHG